ncbi:DNA alkylation repair protein [Cohnella lubricantis]|uniref:DNA alkylation repair protein n=1 Tax=Cohnella lubricantis TaxID=2163172 RepID=A0A841TGV4_9BACL|nr:DNA alkylation repair protein [Cohnella lubricantis]MBB6678177.1 DNA alkylation repair protein [Cohnella lubricantis]MBP2119697.1 3-methyladenine DNA glycosylase AlkD [Cohnella lubricantis]
MEMSLRDRLKELAEEDYRRFASSLIPNIDNLLGVRLPALRKLAIEMAKGDWRAYLAEAENDYFEEIMLQGMVIGYAKTDVEEQLRYAASFVPKIDNWSVCDSFCQGLKFARTNQQRVWEFLQPYLASDAEYEIRFGAVMLLMHYVDEAHIERVLELLDRIDHDAYYVKMAVAWALSICFSKLPEPTLRYLRSDNSLDKFTYNKALQKITELSRTDPETKAMIRGMRRK